MGREGKKKAIEEGGHLNSFVVLGSLRCHRGLFLECLCVCVMAEDDGTDPSLLTAFTPAPLVFSKSPLSWSRPGLSRVPDPTRSRWWAMGKARGKFGPSPFAKIACNPRNGWELRYCERQSEREVRLLVTLCGEERGIENDHSTHM